MPSDTQLRLQYVDLSYDYDFPEALEKKLEDDYVINPHRYTKKTFDCISMYLLIYPDVKFEDLVNLFKHLTK